MAKLWADNQADIENVMFWSIFYILTVNWFENMDQADMVFWPQTDNAISSRVCRYGSYACEVNI